MKILIADQFSEIGGAQRVLLELLPALQRWGWTCVLAVPGDGPLRTRGKELGIRCETIACGPFHSGSKSLSDFARFTAQFSKLRDQFHWLIDDLRPDVFYVNAPRLLPAACSLGRHAPPIVAHVHSYLKQRYAAALAGYSLRRARATVIGNCHFVLDPLRQYLPGATAEVIYNGVPDCSFRARGPRSGRIGIIGRICPEKGQRLFLEAARLVHPSLGQASFMICGGTQFSDPRAESYGDELRQLAAGLPVEFTGWRDDIGDVLHSLDILVVASMPQAEATTRVIPEAYSAGVPVLASDLPGIREILKEGETGFLFPPGNPGALAGRIRALIDGPAQTIEAVTANARRDFEKRFSLDIYHGQLCDKLQSVSRSILDNVGPNART